MARFRQVQLQHLGLKAFDRPEVIRALKPTDAQKASLVEIKAELHPVMVETGRLFLQDREASRAKTLSGIRAASDKAVAMLTDEQKAAWAAMLGAPYQVTY